MIKISITLGFFKVNSMPAIEEDLTAKYYADQAISNSIDEPTLVRINQHHDFSDHHFTNLKSITLNTQVVNDN